METKLLSPSKKNIVSQCNFFLRPSGIVLNCIRGLSLFVFIIIASAGFASKFEPFVNPPDTLKFEPIDESKDSVEYELIIFDPAFDSWFFKNRRPIDFFEKSYLESWNSQLVPQWNSALVSPRHRDCAPTTYLDYRPEIDYGKELNYKLFYYFMYTQQRCRIFSHFPRVWQ
jgi:hypothetical protein